MPHTTHTNSVAGHSLNDSEKLASALADAQVDLNPHQLDAALFAFRSPLVSAGVIPLTLWEYKDVGHSQ